LPAAPAVRTNGAAIIVADVAAVVARKRRRLSFQSLILHSSI
jgi:hypothetical protein